MPDPTAPDPRPASMRRRVDFDTSPEPAPERTPPDDTAREIPCPRWSLEETHPAHEWDAPVDGHSKCPGWAAPVAPDDLITVARWAEANGGPGSLIQAAARRLLGVIDHANYRASSHASEHAAAAEDLDDARVNLTTAQGLLADERAHSKRAYEKLAASGAEVERLRAELAGMRDLFEAANTVAGARTDERDALKAAIAEAVRQIREWMDPDSAGPLFAPGHAAEVDRTLKTYIGEHVIAALAAPESNEAAPSPVSAATEATGGTTEAQEARE